MKQPSDTTIAAFPGGAGTRRPVLGWAMSLLAHAIAAGLVWHASQRDRANADTEAVKRIDIWLVASVLKAPAPVSVPPAKLAPPGRAANRTAGGATATAPVAPLVTRQPNGVDAPSALSSQGGAALIPDGAAPVFDLFAARASARAMARDDRKRLGEPPLRQGQSEPISSDRIQERFERARRVNCLKANDSTNLLANVFFLAKDMVSNAVDDSGCKW